MSTLALPQTPAAESAGQESHDYDLHGLVGIRLIDAEPADIAAVDAQLGPIAAPLGREADIVIRFVDRLRISSPRRYVGVNDAAYTEDDFLILRGKHKAAIRAAVPLDRVGEHVEIRCERGAPAVPLLIALINLTMLARGGLPVHASAFRHHDVGVMVTGWARGGKTEVLLGFVAEGAEYIGDEWIYIDSGGSQMLGIPEPIRVWDWHLAQLPRLRRRLPPRIRMRLRLLRYLSEATALLAGREGKSSQRRRLRAVAELLASQRYTHLPPQSTFGGRFGSLRAPLDRVIFVASHEAKHVAVKPMDSEELAEKMAVSLEEERAQLSAYYRRFRFAFPGRRNPLLESAGEIERDALRRILSGKPCHAVYHPFPPSIAELTAAVRPLVES